MWTNKIWMKRPFNFGFHGPSAESNHFQQKLSHSETFIQQKAQQEFNGLVATLRHAGLEVDVLPFDAEGESMDAVFLNNWFSTHDNGLMVVYPMLVPERRTERRQDMIDYIRSQYEVSQFWSMTHYEDRHLFLESTGSMVLDREHRVVYACKSVRTSRTLLEKWAKRMDYQLIIFDAFDMHGRPVYHTNVLMTMTPHYVMINSSAIPKGDWKTLKSQFSKNNKKIIDISMLQMNQFLGNAIVLQGRSDYPLLLMSSNAYRSLTLRQLYDLSSQMTIIHYPIPTIETVGGGSVRCMIAENFLESKK
ncbi:arginine deiminase-related protein [Membranihabitans marinus]|uniref:arginine deiminase-related protein n=1 Tax=Membranihabitans marinus TaxID=1227546 RepID=UPI001F1F65E9|nr:arginine deiminase-related protein [Membranihabitans marinus]